MALVESHDQIRAQPISEHGNRSVRAAQGEIGIALDEPADLLPVLSDGSFDFERSEPAEERRLSWGPEPGADQVRRFGNDHRGYHELQVSAL